MNCSQNSVGAVAQPEMREWFDGGHVSDHSPFPRNLVVVVLTELADQSLIDLLLRVLAQYRLVRGYARTDLAGSATR